MINSRVKNHYFGWTRRWARLFKLHIAYEVAALRMSQSSHDVGRYCLQHETGMHCLSQVVKNAPEKEKLQLEFPPSAYYHAPIEPEAEPAHRMLPGKSARTRAKR